MAGGEVGDHVAGGDVERGVQVRGAVALVVMGAPLGRAGQHRQHRRGAVQRLDLGLLVDAEHHRRVGRVQVQPDDVADLVDELRVGRQLELVHQVRLEPERPPDPRRPPTATCPSPPPSTGSTSASRRSGVSSRVLTITRSTSSSLIVRGAPGRGSSCSPSRRLRREPGPPLAHRRRVHPQPSAATRCSSSPSAHANTIRHRNANACALFGRRAHRSSVSRSSSLSTISAVGRPRVAICPPIVVGWEDGSRPFRLLLLTPDLGH